MTSKDRILAALRREDVDYLPCTPWFWSSPQVAGYTWNTRAESVEIIVDRLEADTYFPVGVDVDRHPDVTERVWVDHPPGEPYPLLHKEIYTPIGTLSAIVRRTADWPHGDDLPLQSDFNVSRYVKPWLQTMEDVEKYAYIWRPPGPQTIGRAREEVRAARSVADRWGVPLYAGCGMGLTAAIQLFGAEEAVFLSMDHPEILTRFLEIEHRTTMTCLEVLLDLGVDIICRNGFYETTDFWSPTQFETFLMRHLKEEIALVHAGGRPITYTVETGIMPLIPQLAELEFDSLNAIEPVLGDQDMKRIAREVGDRKCIWAGLSAPIHIGQGTPEIVRQAVREAVETFGRRGFILSAVPSIRPHWPWENVMAMIDEWKRIRLGSG